MGYLCCTCLRRPARPGQRNCRECRNESMRRTRPKHRDLSALERKRANARSYLNVYVRRGKVMRPDRCSRCKRVGPVHGHHHDYDKPLDVTWLCPRCHQQEHQMLDAQGFVLT